MTLFLIIAIIIVDFYGNYVAKKHFKGYITRMKNGRNVPAPLEAYKENPALFMKLAKPFLLISSFEFILFICLMVELLK